jgi:protein-tyrosine phosphatase
MNILFVCTGNICRSPMAAVIARRELARLGLEGVEVASAGTAAVGGGNATRWAAVVAEENRLSLSDHRAQRLTRQLVSAADLVVGMEPEHVELARRLGARRAVLLGAGVPDPYGFDVGAYRETWRLIASSLPALLAEHLPPSDPGRG